MANKNLIRRMRQLLILVLILAMTMSFAAMTAMAGKPSNPDEGTNNISAAIKVGKDFKKGEEVTLIFHIAEDNDVRILATSNGAYLKFDMPTEFFSSNGIKTGDQISFETSLNRSGVITVGKHEGNDGGSENEGSIDNGRNNYEGTVRFDSTVPEPVTGSLTIKKVLQNADGTQFEGENAPSFKFTVTCLSYSEEVDVVAGESTTISDLVVGDYTVTESGADGYELVLIDGVVPVDGSTGKTVAVVANGDAPVTVTFTNRVKPDDSGNTPGTGSLTIEKALQNADGTPFEGENAPSFEFTVKDSNGETVTDSPVIVTAGSSQTIEGLDVGTYIVTETEKDGYVLYDIDGGETVATSRKTTVNVGADGAVTVTFTNRVKPDDSGNTGSLTIEKALQNADGTDFTGNDAPSFEFTVTGPNNYSNTVNVTAGGSATIKGLDAGTYTVTETEKDGYVLYDIIGGETVATSRKTTVTVGAGGAVTVTFTNRVKPDDSGNTGSLTIEKALQNADGTDFTGNDAPSFEFTVTGPNNYSNTVNVTAGGSATIKGLDAGTYTVTETEKDGYVLYDIIGGETVATSRKTTVTVGAGGAVTVTFTNRVKSDDSGGDGNGGDGNGGNGNGGTVTPLPPDQNLEDPDTPDTPAEPVEPSEKPLPDDKHTVTDIPKTGDTVVNELLFNLLLLSISALAGMLFYLRRKTTNR
ncbi:MAG: collagen binding domain-containing protein [Anaerovoracaceae bacterium]